MKKLWTLVLTLLIALSSLTVLAREAEEPQTDVEVLSVTAIAETLEEGQKLTALSIEYSEPFAAGAAVTGSFTVEDREVSRVYVNDSGQKAMSAHPDASSSWSFLVSNTPGSSVGTTLFFRPYERRGCEDQPIVFRSIL